MIGSRRSSLKKPRNPSEKLNQRMRKILEDPDVLNALAMVISGPIEGISRRARGRLTM
jgi:hypothetical protein